MLQRTFLLLLSISLAGNLLAQNPDIGVDANYFSDGVSNPLVDNDGLPLTAGPSGDDGDGAVIQIGYLLGVPLAKDPDSFNANDWATFVPLSGEGLNFHPELDFPGHSSIGDIMSGLSGPFGFFGIVTRYYSTTDTNIPATFPQRIAIRFYNGTTVASSTHFTTVSSDNSEWELAISDPRNPGEESTLDLDLHELSWQGTPLRTDQPIGVTPTDLELTNVSLLDATTLQVSWSGGTGNETIQTSVLGDGSDWTNVALGQSSPATITVNTGVTPTLLVRVVTP